MNPTCVRRPFRLRPTLLAIALALALPTAGVHAQANDSGRDVTTPLPFSIASKPLAQALADWSAQSRIPLSVAPDLVAGKTGSAVSGDLAPMQALQQLLANADLGARADATGVVITPSAATPTLAPIRVRTSAEATPLGYLSKRSGPSALGDKAVLDTPFSITTVSSEQITERGAKSIGQIFFNDASVSTPTSSSTTDWWGTQIRGLGVRNNYVDDIPMLLYWGGDFPVEVIEDVTALKGLTGFMYGFGEPGGALSYRLKRPTSTTETSVTIGYRNPRLVSAHVDTNHVFGDELSLRANLATEQGKAYNASHVDRVVASVALDKQFGASVKWFSTLVYEDARLKGEPLQFYLDPYDVAGSGGVLPRVDYDYERMNVDNSSYATRMLLASTGVDWRIDDRWTLKSRIGASRREHRSNKAFANLLNREGDYDGFMYAFAGQLENTFGQTVLNGAVTLGGMKHEFVGGIGLQRSRDRWSRFAFDGDFSGNLFAEQPFQVTRPADYTLAPVSSDTRQRYAFFSDTVHFTDRLQLLAGVRYTHYEMDDYKVGKASPTLALIYKPDADTSLYGSYVEALEPGTLVSPPLVNEGELLGATVSKQSEIGIKHQSGRVEYTAALFRIERANQMEVPRGTGRALTQDGVVEYRGLELSAAHQATRELNVGVGAVFLDAIIDKVSDEKIAVQGNTPSNAAKWQGVVHAEYKVPSLAGLKLQGSVRYFGATFAADDNLLEVPGRTVVNAGFSHEFRMQGLPWTVYGNLNNVFNKKYWANGGWGQGNFGEARNASVALKTTF